MLCDRLVNCPECTLPLAQYMLGKAPAHRQPEQHNEYRLDGWRSSGLIFLLFPASPRIIASKMFSMQSSANLFAWLLSCHAQRAATEGTVKEHKGEKLGQLANRHVRKEALVGRGD